MSKALIRRIKELCAEPIYLGATEAELHREIAENCWSISASDEERSQVTPAELTAALDELIECYRVQVTSHPCGHGAIFYTWFDEQACQLRCCLISDIHSELPFNRDVTYLPSALPIIQDFLASSETIPESDLIDVPWDEPAEISAAVTPLRVYEVRLS